MLSKIEQVVRASAKIDNFLADSAFIMNFEQVFDSRNTNEFQVVSCTCLEDANNLQFIGVSLLTIYYIRFMKYRFPLFQPIG